MNYYLDTEFLEGTQKKTFLGINVGETKPTIDLISIGIVTEDNREYYAISKDFNLKEAWNRYDLKPDIDNGGMKKVYWIRENVLRPIFYELQDKSNLSVRKEVAIMGYSSRKIVNKKFTLSNLRWLIKNYGKSNEQIAEDIKEFCSNIVRSQNGHKASSWNNGNNYRTKEPIFYAYFADYDWVAFCWLFGKMMDLPNGFPMYCRDLKQELDNLYAKEKNEYKERKMRGLTSGAFINKMSEHPSYPKQQNEHNALDDARWNKKLHEFIKSI